MENLIVFLPALGWGLMPLVAQLTKASPKEQLTGTTLTALLFALAIYFVEPTPFVLVTFIISFISGILWAIGQLLQFQSFQKMSVQKVIPIICGLQLIGTTLFAAIVFNEWATRIDIIVGSMALFSILIGICLTSYQAKQENSSPFIPVKYLMTLFCSAFALISYVIINQFFGVSGLEVILPQAIGMVTSALVINLFTKTTLRSRKVSLNLLTGLCWSVANVSLFIANGTVGIAKSFPISQGSIVIATLGGILIFKERKNHREWVAVIGGIMAVMGGVLMISFVK